MTAATCEWCGVPLAPSKGSNPRKYCSPRCNKHAWRERSDNRERERVAARAWKDAHRDETRAYDAAYDATVKGACTRCDSPMARRNDGGVCRACRSGDAAERAERIVAMWAGGARLREIAGRLGTTVNHVGVEMVRLRAKGYDLPYRKPRRPDLAPPAEKHGTRADGTPSPSLGGGLSPAGAAAQTSNEQAPATRRTSRGRHRRDRSDVR